MKKLFMFTLFFMLIGCSGTPSGGGGGGGGNINPDDPNTVKDATGASIGTYVKSTADYIELLSPNNYYFFVSREGMWYPYFKLSGTEQNNPSMDSNGDKVFLFVMISDQGKKYYFTWNPAYQTIMKGCSTTTQSNGGEYQWIPNTSVTVGQVYNYTSGTISGGGNSYEMTECTEATAGVPTTLYPPFTKDGQIL